VGSDADKFTLFFINDQAATFTDGTVSLAGKTGDLSLKATTADGASIIKLKVNLTAVTSSEVGVETIIVNTDGKEVKSNQ